MTLTPADLCKVFRDRASATHALIDYSYSVGLGVSEESITDILLVEMRRLLPPSHVYTKKFTKHEESSASGADWLWVIGRPGRWISLLMQAKLVRPNALRVHGLHHGKPEGSQRQTLVQYALKESCIPLYVVYTAFSAAPPVQIGQRGRPKANPNAWKPPCPAAIEDATQMGCILVRPRHVALMMRGKTGKDNAATLINRGHPWACMFCGHGTKHVELADAALAGVEGLFIDSPAPTSPGGSSTPTPDDVLGLDAERFILRSPPAVVVDILAGREPEADPPFAAVSVISSEALFGAPPTPTVL